ncbi:ClpX C4-type zinc finger protein [Streptosporangium carneum]|uniref:ClpX-type ZB domain-containing protein n=1 Tax=Streptosporangium carneum TaxID=47481 RepID=A0A9W6MD19_9ACTN|nr:hypothetical protein GCM10017600_34650 [Streptosporangium carneum]
MPAPSLAEQEIHCSFCAKSRSLVEKIIAGPGVYICNECVGLCNAILDELSGSSAGKEEAAGKPSPEGREGSEIPEIPWPEGMTDEEILAYLPRVAAASARVDADLQVWVQRLRDRGVTWARIGAALGMARQSAWERFSGEE